MVEEIVIEKLEKEKVIEALDEIEGQIECGYIDLNDIYPEELLFAVVIQAIKEYRINHNL